MSSIRSRTIAGLRVGDTFIVSRTFTEQETHAFGEMTRDYNPIHYDDRFAAAKGFDRRICHGLLIGSLLTEVGGQIGCLASSMDFRFKKPVYFNDRIECRLTIVDIDQRLRATAQAAFTNQFGVLVIEATLRGILPNKLEKEVLRQMIAEGDSTNASLY